MSHVRRAGLLVLALVCIALFAAACGDDDDESQPSGGGGDNAADTGGGDDQSGGAGEKSVTDYVDYVGGKAGKADPNKSTIYIGWLNQRPPRTAPTWPSRSPTSSSAASTATPSR